MAKCRPQAAMLLKLAQKHHAATLSYCGATPSAGRHCRRCAADYARRIGYVARQGRRPVCSSRRTCARGQANPPCRPHRGAYLRTKGGTSSKRLMMMLPTKVVMNPVRRVKKGLIAAMALATHT